MLRTPNILFNLARSEQLTGHSLEALAHYKTYARDTDGKITPPDRDTAKSHIAELVPKVGHVSVEAPVGAKITVDGAEAPGEAPFEEPLDVEVGKHTVVARVGEATRTLEVTPAMGETVPARFAFDAPAVGPALPVGPLNPGDGTAPPPPGGSVPGTSSAKIATVIALGAGGLIALGIGVGFTVAASNEAGNITADQQGLGMSECLNTMSVQCTQLGQANSAHNTDVVLRNGFLVGGGVLLAGAVAAWVLWPGPPKSGKVGWELVPVVTRTGANLGLSGRF